MICEFGRIRRPGALSAVARTRSVSFRRGECMASAAHPFSPCRLQQTLWATTVMCMWLM